MEIYALGTESIGSAFAIPETGETEADPPGCLKDNRHTESGGRSGLPLNFNHRLPDGGASRGSF